MNKENKMSDYKIQSVNYSKASNFYDKYAKALEHNSTHGVADVRDSIVLNSQEKVDLGGVETSIGKKNDVLGSGDEIIIQSKGSQNKFFNFIQAQLSKIAASEKTAAQAVDQEVSLVELSASINEAEIALQQVVQTRDKLVNCFNEITKMAF